MVDESELHFASWNGDINWMRAVDVELRQVRAGLSDARVDEIASMMFQTKRFRRLDPKAAVALWHAEQGAAGG